MLMNMIFHTILHMQDFEKDISNLFCARKISGIYLYPFVNPFEFTRYCCQKKERSKRFALDVQTKSFSLITNSHPYLYTMHTMITVTTKSKFSDFERKTATY